MPGNSRWSQEDIDALNASFAKHPNNKKVAISAAARVLKRTKQAVAAMHTRLTNGTSSNAKTSSEPTGNAGSSVVAPPINRVVKKRGRPFSNPTVSYVRKALDSLNITEGTTLTYTSKGIYIKL